MLFDAMILLNVEDAALVERICGRRLDPVTNEIYHIKYKPAPSAEIQGRLITRADDTEASLKKRLALYHASRTALLEHYAKIVLSIDASQTPKKIYEDCLKAMRKKGLRGATQTSKL